MNFLYVVEHFSEKQETYIITNFLFFDNIKESLIIKVVC